MKPQCERCGAETTISIMSRFSTNMICPDCQEIEKRHPKYRLAHDAEFLQVRAGRFNFQGIGAPSDLVESSIQARLRREGVSENPEEGAVARRSPAK